MSLIKSHVPHEDNSEATAREWVCILGDVRQGRVMRILTKDGGDYGFRRFSACATYENTLVLQVRNASNVNEIFRLDSIRGIEFYGLEWLQEQYPGDAADLEQCDNVVQARP